MKNKKSSNSQTPSKPLNNKTPLNPFEVHINHSKHTVLGQKSKDDRGLPGVSRGKAFHKREKTLLHEYRNRYKDSQFLDKRIGEKNKFLDPEKKIWLRIAAEKKKQFSRKSMYNLNDDEELTHGGKALTEDAMRDTTIFDEDGDDDDDDQLDNDFVKKQHFGGGLLTKRDESADVGKDGIKSRKEWIEEIIAESKKKKAENHKEKEIQQEAVSKLDAKLQDFFSLMRGKIMTDADKEKSKKTCEFRDYDMIVKEMAFDRSRRATAADRMKTEEELAKEEEQRLRTLEEERQRRMKGDHQDLGAKHDPRISADALDDGFVPARMEIGSNVRMKNPNPVPVNLNTKMRNQEDASYSSDEDEGKSEEDDEEGNSESEEEEDEDENMENEEGNIEVESEEEEEEDQLENKNKKDDNIENEEEEEEVENEEEEEEENIENEEELESDEEEGSSKKEEGEKEMIEILNMKEKNIDEDNFGEEEDIFDEDEDELLEEEEEHNNEELKSSVEEIDINSDDEKEDSQTKSSEEEPHSLNMNNLKIGEDKLPKRDFNGNETGEESEELPYTFEVPAEYDGFWNLLQDKSPSQVSTIIERMISCNHPKLGGENNVKANTIFAYILQTLHMLCQVEAEYLRKDVHPLSYIDSLVPHLYALTQLNPPDCARAMMQVIDEKYEEYTTQRPRKYPSVDTFIFLKIGGLLFPSSDYYHPVMTRVIVFLIQILGEAKVCSGRDVLALLFTSSLLFEYLNRSTRFVGELMNALNGVLYLSIRSDKAKLSLPHTLPFKRFGPSSDLLVLDNPHLSYTPFRFTLASLNATDLPITNDLKVSLLNETLKAIDNLSELWTHNPSVRSIFHPTTKLLKALRTENYPQETTSLIESLETSIGELPSQAPHLAKVETQTKTLRMMQPAIEEIIDGVKKRGGSREFLEKQKLVHKVKRERKGARRELKRDAQFIAREQLKEVLASDAERKRKVNLIMHGLAVQESEHKKLKNK